MKYFIRFTDDIQRDLERGSSSNLFTEDEFEGLCAYLLKLEDPYGDVVEQGIERAKELAGWNGKNYADYYEGNFVILEGEDAGNGIDGKIVRNAEVIYEGNIND